MPQFDFCVLQLIANDAKTSSPETVANNTAKLVDFITMKKVTKRVIVSSELPVIDNEMLDAMVEASNRLTQLKLINSTDTCFLNNTSSFMRGGHASEHLFEDSIHINDEGVKLLSANI